MEEEIIALRRWKAYCTLNHCTLKYFTMQFTRRVFEKKNEEKDFFYPNYFSGFRSFLFGLSWSARHIK